MITYIAVLVLSAVVSFAMTPFVRILAFRWHAIDIPNDRKIHREIMPRLGGISIFVGFFATWIGFYVVDNRISLTFQDYERLMAHLVAGGILVLLLGIYDDIRGANAVKKLTVQCLAAGVLIAGGFRIDVITNPMGGQWELGWMAVPVSMLWIVGLTNAVNLLDGIDGLATGVVAGIALCLAVINIFFDNILVAIITLSLTGACLGFLPHNFYPAKIFLGDSGSLLLGMLISCIGILSLFKAVTATFVLAPVIMFGLPIFDTASVMWSRLRQGTPIFRADRSHVHHRLLLLGWTQQRTVIVLYGVTLALGLVAVLMSVRSSPGLTAILALIVGGFAAGCYRAMHRRSPDAGRGRGTVNSESESHDSV